MNKLTITILGLFFGMLGTTLGGIVGAFFDIKSKRIISFILELAAGLMTAVICFDLIPEGLKFVSLSGSIFGIIVGVVVMILCNDIVNKKLKITSHSNLLKTGIIIGIGLTIHNLPEGLAIGSGFEASSKLGLSLAIAICIHDFPEGVSMAVPLKQGGVSKFKVILYTTISGISTGVGALLGAILGNISSGLIGFSLSFAARCNALYCFM
jgi:ZIP family zinc transporter